jgi:nucleotide-binding universal stress UspA family protein
MRSRDQFPSPLHSEGPFFVQHVSPALPKAPVLRVTPGQHVISGIPSKLTQLLLLTDLRAESRPAVEFAIELTRHFTARLTLMHGEPLQSGSTFGREDLPTSLDSDPARLALLCLMWEVRQRGLDVGLSTEAGHAPEQIWRTAAERNVDLIVLPESLFGSFRPVVNRSDTFEAVQGAPCPLLIVEDRIVPPVDFS